MDTKPVTFKFDTVVKDETLPLPVTRASLLIGGYKLQYCIASNSFYEFIDVWHKDDTNRNIFGFGEILLDKHINFKVGEESKQCVATYESAYSTTCEFASYVSPNTHEPIPEELVDFLYRLIIAILNKRKIEIVSNKEIVANG